MNYTYRQDFWTPKLGSYETTPEGWALYQAQCSVDMLSLKELYPELSSWGDIERMDAWTEFCQDYNFTTWIEPYREEHFLLYLRLTQEGRLPDCSDNPEAFYELVKQEAAKSS